MTNISQIPPTQVEGSILQDEEGLYWEMSDTSVWEGMAGAHCEFKGGIQKQLKHISWECLISTRGQSLGNLISPTHTAMVQWCVLSQLHQRNSMYTKNQAKWWSTCEMVLFLLRDANCLRERMKESACNFCFSNIAAINGKMRRGGWKS